MIKKYKFFINESIQIKTEYQLFHLNNKEKKEYFLIRLDFIKNHQRYYFKEFEFDLLPKIIREEYNELCVDRDIDIPLYQFETFTNELKIKFIDLNIKHDYLDDIYFNFINDELKNYTINSVLNSNQLKLTINQFKWCNDELKEKYIDLRIINKFGVDDEFFKECSKNSKLKIINNKLSSGYWLSELEFKFLPPIRKFKYIDFLVKKRFWPLEKIGKYEREWYLNYKKKNNLL